MSANSLDGIDYAAFRLRAKEEKLSPSEKIGFPNMLRDGRSREILCDIIGKMPALAARGKSVADIGCGCGELAQFVVRQCELNEHRLFLVDSPEMLIQVSARDAHRVCGRFPEECADFLRDNQGQMDAVICYSVLQHVLLDGDVQGFVDKVLSLLKEGGRALFGDIPNYSMRNRFFGSTAGRISHEAYAKDGTPPPIAETIPAHRLSDEAVIALTVKVRQNGFHAFIVPQGADLPFANRREDLLIVRP